MLNFTNLFCDLFLISIYPSIHLLILLFPQQNQSSPHHHQQQQTPPIPSHQPQSHPPPQLYTLEQLEAGAQMGGGNGGAIMDPRTPIAQSNAQIGILNSSVKKLYIQIFTAILSAAGIGGPSSQHSQPGTPQQQQMPQNGQIFSPHQMICAADLMNEANGGTAGAQNGGALLSDQQQQYLLAAAFGRSNLFSTPFIITQQGLNQF
jgi:hypothetical protein